MNIFNLVGVTRKVKAFFFPTPCNTPFEPRQDYLRFDESTGELRNSSGDLVNDKGEVLEQPNTRKG